MQFYGQFNPQVDQILYERYFSNKMNGISIEAGAFDGIFENSTYFFNKNFNWKTINIEPLPHIYKNLVKNRISNNDINLNIALSDKNGSDIITVYNMYNYGINNTNASLKHLEQHKLYLKNNSIDFQEFNVITKTYKILIEELKITELDLFVLDVEGFETNVIDGMIDCDILPKVFVIEHGHRDINFFTKYIEEKLGDKYKLDYVSHVNSFYVLN
jgi:FkbM family methyltransferase